MVECLVSLVMKDPGFHFQHDLEKKKEILNDFFMFS